MAKMLLFIRLWLPGSRFLFEHWNLNLEAFLSERTFPLCVERSDFPFSYFNIFHYFLGSVLSASMKLDKCWAFYLHKNLWQSWGLYDIILKLVSVAQHPSSPGNRGEKTKKQTKKNHAFSEILLVLVLMMDAQFAEPKVPEWSDASSQPQKLSKTWIRFLLS